MKGSYILLINLPKAQRIRVGSLGIVDFLSGCYAYVGSALRGFESRLPHHLGNSKKPHWHIDYLLQKAPITSIIIFESDKRAECMIAKALEGQFAYVLDFGCSDCRCKSHLFFAPDEATIKSRIMKLGLKSSPWDYHLPTSSAPSPVPQPR